MPDGPKQVIADVARRFATVGRRVRWKDVVAGEHGLVYGARRYGDFARTLRTPNKSIDVADAELLGVARRLLSEPPVGAPDGYPFHFNNRRRNIGMNSWLNDLPSQSGRQGANRAVDPLSGTAAFNDQFVAVRSSHRVSGE